REAWEKAKENKDKGFFEKVKIFFSTFREEMNKVDEEQEEVSEETTKKVKQGVDETMKDAREAVALDKSVDKDDCEFHDEMVATAASSFEEMDEKYQTAGYGSVAKLQKAVEGKPEQMEFEEARAISGVAFMTLRKLKEQYPTKEKFKAALDRFAKISEKSKFPLEKLLSMSVLKTFKIKLPGVGDLFSGKLGKVTDLSDFMGELGLGMEDAWTLKGIRKSPPENRDEIVKILNEKIFKKTSATNVGRVTDILSKMIANKEDKLSTETLSELAFLIDNADFDNLVTVLVGKHG
ncbi:MAG: hypothetical protein ABIH78_00650, partial [Candidatus Peregrinibacteria bacterium]